MTRQTRRRSENARHRVYPLEKKLQVVREILNTNRPIMDIAEEYEVGRGSIYEWKLQAERGEFGPLENLIKHKAPTHELHRIVASVKDVNEPVEEQQPYRRFFKQNRFDLLLDTLESKGVLTHAETVLIRHPK